MRASSKIHFKKRGCCSAWTCLIALFFIFNVSTFADDSGADHASHHPKGSDSSMPSSAPLAPLEKALENNPPKLSKKKKTKQSKDMGSQSMPPAGAAGGGMMGKDMMSHMNQMGQMMIQMGKPPGATAPMVASSSELPGFPGASHIYHIGGTGFFLDHSDMISLTPEQQTALNQTKEKALSNEATSERKIDQAEQELWFLTSSDKPDIESIESKIKEIEVLKGDQRISFIRSVGEAAKVLTPDQRAVLLGRSSPQKQMAPNSPSNTTMPQSSGMEAMPPSTPPSSNMGGKSGGGMEKSMEPGDM